MLTKIRIIIPSDLLAKFDSFIEELKMIPTSGSDLRSDVICAAIEAYMEEWKKVTKKKEAEEEKAIPLPRSPPISALAALRGEYVKEEYKGGIS